MHFQNFNQSESGRRRHKKPVNCQQASRSLAKRHCPLTVALLTAAIAPPQGTEAAIYDDGQKMTPEESARVYGNPETWDPRWRHCHYANYFSTSARLSREISGLPQECLSKCLGSVPDYGELQQACVNSCNQYFLRDRSERTIIIWDSFLV